MLPRHLCLCILLGGIGGCSAPARQQTSTPPSADRHDEQRAANTDDEDRFHDEDGDAEENRFLDKNDDWEDDELQEEESELQSPIFEPLLETDASKLCGNLTNTRERLFASSNRLHGAILGLHAEARDMIARGWQQEGFCKKYVKTERKTWQRKPGNVGMRWPHAMRRNAWCKESVKRYKKKLKAKKKAFAVVESESSRAQNVAKACFAEARKRASERAAAATTLSMEQIEAIPVQYRIREEHVRRSLVSAKIREEERALAKEERDEEARIIAARKADPQWMRPLHSAYVCAHRGSKRETLKEIQTEKRYAKVGGIVSKSKLYELQQDLRHFDERIAVHKKGLKSLGVKPSPCKSKRVQLLTECIRSTVETFISPALANRASVFGNGVKAGVQKHRSPVCEDESIIEFVPLL